MIEEFLLIVRTIVVLVVIFIMIFLLVNIRYTVSSREIERTTVQISEALLTSKLTVTRAIFDPTQLNKYDNSVAEPYSQCKYAYNIVIEEQVSEISAKNKEQCKPHCAEICNIPEKDVITDINDPNRNCAIRNLGFIKGNVCACKKTPESNFILRPTWKFGYQYHGKADIAGDAKTKYSIDLTAAVYDGTVIPATMHLTVYRTWLSEISCLVEKARLSKQIQKMKIPCIKTLNYMGCGIPLIQEGNKLCVAEIDDIRNPKKIVPSNECREIDTNIITFWRSYDTPKKVRTLKIIPITKTTEEFNNKLTVENARDIFENDPAYIDYQFEALESPQISMIISGEMEKICRGIEKYTATKEDNVKSVILCMEDD
jgi:hypothetical protein